MENKNLQIPVSNDIVLELVSEKRLEEFFVLIDKNRDYLKKWLPWLNNITKMEDELVYINESKKNYEDGIALSSFIIYKDILVGICGFNEIKNNIASLGAWISEEYSGFGIMTKSLDKLMEYGYSDLDIENTLYHCATGNVKSNNMAKRLGFKYLYTHEHAENLYGTWVDHNVYELTKEKYLSLREEELQ